MKLIFFHAITSLLFTLPVQLKYNIQPTVNSTGQVDSNTLNKHYVGEVLGGGVVFYVYKDENDKERCLIVSLKQLSSEAVWGPFKNVPGCENRWDGASNTAAILKHGGSSTDAAGLCAGYSQGGFDDWYLPSIEELKELGRNSEAVNKTLKSLAGAQVLNTEMSHWSSTEVSDDSRYSAATTACYEALDPSNIKTYGGLVGDKVEKRYVRAVREFQ
jgi:hypothetical protein